MFNSAGMERVVSNKAQFLSARGHEITIITANQNGRPYFYDVPACVKKIDFALNSFEYDDKPIIVKIFSFLKKEKDFKHKLSCFLNQNHQDVVIALEDRFVPMLVQVSPKGTVLVGENHFNKFAYVELGKSVNRNFIQTIIYNLRNWYIKKRYHNLLDAYVLLTREDFDYRNGRKDNFVVIPNSVNYSESKRAALDKKVVIAVGRLSYQKGFERLLESWAIVSEQCPEWKLQIYGDGEDKQKLIDICNKKKLKDSVTIYPPTPTIEQRLLDSSIYVMSSRFEGLPMVLIEAMSVGLPVVSFDCKTGPKDLIKDGYSGYLVSEGDTETLADRIIKLIQNAELRKEIGRNSKCESRKYSHECIALRWEELFNTLMTRKK